MRLFPCFCDCSIVNTSYSNAVSMGVSEIYFAATVTRETNTAKDSNKQTPCRDVKERLTDTVAFPKPLSLLKQ